MLLSRPAVALLLLRLGGRRAEVERLLDDFLAVDLRAVERFAVERLLDDFFAVDFLRRALLCRHLSRCLLGPTGWGPRC